MLRAGRPRDGQVWSLVDGVLVDGGNNHQQCLCMFMRKNVSWLGKNLWFIGVGNDSLFMLAGGQLQIAVYNGIASDR